VVVQYVIIETVRFYPHMGSDVHDAFQAETEALTHETQGEIEVSMARDRGKASEHLEVALRCRDTVPASRCWDLQTFRFSFY